MPSKLMGINFLKMFVLSVGFVITPKFNQSLRGLKTSIDVFNSAEAATKKSKKKSSSKKNLLIGAAAIAAIAGTIFLVKKNRDKKNQNTKEQSQPAFGSDASLSQYPTFAQDGQDHGVTREASGYEEQQRAPAVSRADEVSILKANFCSSSKNAPHSGLFYSCWHGRNQIPSPRSASSALVRSQHALWNLVNMGSSKNPESHKAMLESSKQFRTFFLDDNNDSRPNLPEDDQKYAQKLSCKSDEQTLTQQLLIKRANGSEEILKCKLSPDSIGNLNCASKDLKIVDGKDEFSLCDDSQLSAEQQSAQQQLEQLANQSQAEQAPLPVPPPPSST